MLFERIALIGALALTSVVSLGTSSVSAAKQSAVTSSVQTPARVGLCPSIYCR
jgi:hypothetical protein